MEKKNTISHLALAGMLFTAQPEKPAHPVVPIEDVTPACYHAYLPSISRFLEEPRVFQSSAAEKVGLHAQKRPDQAEVPVISSTLVYTEDTSLWEHPMDNPSGLNIVPAGPYAGMLLVSDGEQNEKDPDNPAPQNIAIFNPDTRKVLATYSSLPASDEPAGIAGKTGPDGGLALLFADDTGKREVVEAETSSESSNVFPMNKIDVEPVGLGDPEGISRYIRYGREYISIAGGSGNSIYTFDSGENGVLDGTCPDGDDAVRTFSTDLLGPRDPEGIFSLPDEGGTGVSHYIVGHGDRDYISVYREEGNEAILSARIDIGVLRMYRRMSGIAVLPDGKIAIALRGTDNNADPNERDGILAILEPDSLQEIGE